MFSSVGVKPWVAISKTGLIVNPVPKQGLMLRYNNWVKRKQATKCFLESWNRYVMLCVVPVLLSLLDNFTLLLDDTMCDKSLVEACVGCQKSEVSVRCLSKRRHGRDSSSVMHDDAYNDRR